MATVPYNPGYFTTTDPRKMAQWGYQAPVAREPQFWDRTQGRMQGQEGLEQNFLMTGYGLYDPILAGQGGYSPEEAANIIGEGRLENLQLTPEERNAMFLTPEEQGGIYGNPYAGKGYFNPGQQWGIEDEATKRKRESYQQMQQGLEGSIVPEALRPSEGFAPGLAASAAYTKNAMEGAIDPTKLGLSESYQQNYPMTEQEKQDLITGAGMSVRQNYLAGLGDVERRAATAGGGGLGLGALRSRYGRESAAAAGDALTRARIGASAEEARRQDVMESRRLQAEQELARQKTGAARDIWDVAYNAAVTPEKYRLETEQDIANRRERAALLGGQTKLNTETDIGQSQQDLARDLRDIGISLEQYGDMTASQRAAALAQARQQSEQYGQGERFNRQSYADTALSNRYQTAANERLAQQKEARGWVTGQQAQASNQYNQAAQQQIQGFNAATGAANRATDTAARYDIAKSQQPTWYEKLYGGVTGAISGAATGAAIGGPAGAVFGAGMGGWQGATRRNTYGTGSWG